MKKVLTILLAVFMVLCLAGCGKEEASTPAANGGTAEVPAEEPKNILYITTGTLGSGGNEDKIAETCNKAAEAHGGKCIVFECAYDASLYESSVMDGCASKEYDLIVAGYYNLQEAVMKAAAQYPDQKFLTFDVAFDYTNGQNQNVVSFQGRQSECGFLSGVIAALLTTSGIEGTNPDKVVGFVGAAENTAIQDYLVGYIDGVNSVDTGIEVLYSFVGDWSNTALSKELGFAQINEGADVSYSVCGNAGLGNAEALFEKGHYNLNVDRDWSAEVAKSNPEMAKIILTSSEKKYDEIMSAAIEDYFNGKLEFGCHHLVGISDDAITMHENETFNKLFEGDLLARYNQIKQDVIDGKIKVDTAIGMSQEDIAAKKELAKAY